MNRQPIGWRKKRSVECSAFESRVAASGQSRMRIDCTVYFFQSATNSSVWTNWRGIPRASAHRRTQRARQSATTCRAHAGRARASRPPDRANRRCDKPDVRSHCRDACRVPTIGLRRLDAGEVIVRDLRCATQHRGILAVPDRQKNVAMVGDVHASLCVMQVALLAARRNNRVNEESAITLETSMISAFAHNRSNAARDSSIIEIAKVLRARHRQCRDQPRTDNQRFLGRPLIAAHGQRRQKPRAANREILCAVQRETRARVDERLPSRATEYCDGW